MPYKIRTDEGFPSLGEVKKNFKVKWYRSPIDPAKLRKLMQRSDLQGGLQTFGHLGLFTVTGIATAYFFIHNQWVLFALSLWCKAYSRKIVLLIARSFWFKEFPVTK